MESRLLVTLGLLLCLGGCRPQPATRARADARPMAAAPAWPSLPPDVAQAERLISARTIRDPAPAGPRLGAADLTRLPALVQGSEKLIAGEQAVFAWLQRRLDGARASGRRAFLLFGTFHDSGGQVLAFRRTLGALTGFEAITVEQLDADGAWAGAPASLQRGDDELLARFYLRGERRDLRELGSRQHRNDYTAWKYGFVDEILDLVVAARALGQPLAGCDMPRALQDRAALPAATRDRLRELHCLLGVEQRGPRQVAMLWGQEHVRPRGLRRFLPAGALAISLYLVGQRPGPLTPEAELARELQVNDLLLVPLDDTDEHLALLLPGAPLGGEVSRAREWLGAAERGPVRLRVGSQLAGELFIAGRMLRVGPEEQELQLAPAASGSYLLRAGKHRVAGAVELAPGSSLELWFDPARRSTRLQIATPRP